MNHAQSSFDGLALDNLMGECAFGADMLVTASSLGNEE
jgi:hypothetical protein